MFPCFLISWFQISLSTLYLIATPIGNLEDITLRAIRLLKEVSLIAAEDTRTSRKLLSHLDIHTPVTSLYEHNERAKVDTILSALERGDVAVISEAGTPGLSDPGAQVVRAAVARGIRVVPIPGASAMVAALVASGLPTEQFLYLGFLPRGKRERRELLESVEHEMRTLVAFEAPHRLRDALRDLEAVLGNRPICAARELTKVHEEFLRGRVTELRAHFDRTAPRGEFTLVIAGMQKSTKEQAREIWPESQIRKRVAQLLAQDVTRTEAVKRVARESGRDRREVYGIALGKTISPE